MRFLGKMWRGEYPLWVNFWIFGYAVFICISIITVGFLLPKVSDAAVKIPFGFSIAFLAIIFGFPAYVMIVFRGIWKSADQYTGIPGFGIAAKGAVVVMFCYFVRFTYDVLSKTWLFR